MLLFIQTVDEEQVSSREPLQRAGVGGSRYGDMGLNGLRRAADADCGGVPEQGAPLKNAGMCRHTLSGRESAKPGGTAGD